MDKWMKNNNFNKILALVFGVILWTIVHVDTAPTNQTTVSTQSKIIENVKIEQVGIDNDKYVYTFDADSVRMEVRGKNSDLNFKLSDAYNVMVDLSDVGPGDTTLPLNYDLPSGVSLVEMIPHEVNVHVELRNTKSFPVTLVTNGKPAEGYQLGTAVIDPAEVEVTLPASELGNVSKVQGTLELDGDSANISEKKVRLAAYDSSGNEIKNAVIEPSIVSVELPITLPFKSLPLDVSFTGQLPGSLVLSRVTPEVDTIMAYGSEEALAGLSSYEASLDLSSIKSAGTEQVKLDLKPPEGTAKIEPAAVSVTVSVAQIAERTMENIPIKLEGVGSGLTAVVTDPAAKAVTLTLSGAPTLLDQLDQDNISVVADVGGLSAGVHQVSLQISVPRFISLVNSSQPHIVTIDLQAPATPGTTDKPNTGSAPTPEPSSEPVSGEEANTEPSNSGGAATATPAPTASTSENSSTPAGTGNANNAASTGGT
ncbi:CdaA regulatory protein CdaR [Paenibacillus auburnensis]|uniref:CdaA regulatory protein CdaR n=1 Tax=Paenibacillus auburnensis TaxID=2905649 RepID=A0ABN8GXS3_9BACL|nr:CdaR family protein [Paenibacillus auburnensis]CAH1221629.1 CdaA regulatory protein CdaR [Paenibacillus auburnensis]